MQEENYWDKALKKKLSRRQLIKSGAMAGLAGAMAGVSGCFLQGSGSTGRSGAGNPKRGGTIRYNLGMDLPHWDVHTAESYLTAGPTQYAYSGLLKLDEVRSDDLQTEFTFHNDLAESYEQPEPNVFIFRLRRGVMFHEKPPVNGRELTAEDVKYSLDRIRTPEPQYMRRLMFDDVDKIEIADKYTVEFTLSRPSVPFLYNLASPWMLIAAKEVIERDGNLKKTMIGTGPFMLDGYTRNSSLRFKRNPNYFLKDRPSLDAIEVRMIPDAGKALAALHSKELDLGMVSYAEAADLKKANRDVEIVRVPGQGRMVCFMRFDRPPLNDVRVRRALMYATDRQEFIDTVAQGEGKADGPLQWWLKPFALPEDELPGTDLEKARELLAEAGFANGITIQATVSNNLNGVQLAEIAQAQWQRVGVELEIKTLEWGVWLNTVWSKRDFAVYFLQDWNYEDPDRWLLPYFHSKSSQNFVGYADAEVDAWLDEQRQAFDIAKRVDIIQKIQRKLLEDVAYIPLFTPIAYFARHPYVRDWGPYAIWPAQHSFGALRGWLDK